MSYLSKLHTVSDLMVHCKKSSHSVFLLPVAIVMENNDFSELEWHISLKTLEWLG